MLTCGSVEKECEQRRRARARARERREQAEARERLGIKPGVTPTFLREYYSFTFMKWITQVRQDGRYVPGPSPKYQAFWRPVSPQTYTAEAGRALVQRYLSEVGDEMRELVVTVHGGSRSASVPVPILAA